MSSGWGLQVGGRGRGKVVARRGERGDIVAQGWGCSSFWSEEGRGGRCATRDWVGYAARGGDAGGSGGRER